MEPNFVLAYLIRTVQVHRFHFISMYELRPLIEDDTFFFRSPFLMGCTKCEEAGEGDALLDEAGNHLLV